MNKYYTPKSEEFHIGFEYEISDTWGGYMKRTFTDFNPIGVGSGNDRVPYDYEARVKYLDQEDIESLGGSIEHSPLAPKNNKIYSRGEGGFNRYKINNHVMQHYTSEDRIVIASPFSTVFNGTIKNKSELKVILKQLRIL